MARPWSWSPEPPDTSAPAWCAASPARDAPCARWPAGPSCVEQLDGVEAVQGDLVTGAGLERALDGCATAYYLVHSMEALAGERRSVRRPRPHRRRALRPGGGGGGRRAGRLPRRDRARRRPLSAHLRSRLEVERILLDAVPGSTALRASIVVGAGSSSFRILVRLVERLRVLPLPAWRGNRTQPIAERDVIEYLARTPQVPAAAGRSLDVVGPDVLTYAEMIERIAEAMGVGRLPLGVGASLTPPASRRRRRGHRPAARARASADGEPRVRSAPARARRGARPVRDPPAPVRPRRRARARRVGDDRAAGCTVRVERTTHIAAPPQAVYDVVMDAQRLGDWVTVHDHLEDAPQGSLKKGSTADSGPQADGPQVQGEMAGGGERPLPPGRVGGPRAGGVARSCGVSLRPTTGTAPTSHM